MTDPKEKTTRPIIKERTPKKRVTSDPFPNLRRPADLGPSAVEEIMGIASATPVETPVPTPVDTPVETPVATGVSTGVSIRSEASLPAERREREPYLDATHTASEKSVYSIMYRETITKGARERHFGFKELSEKTGLRSDATIRRALDGLLAKLSVEIITYHHGSPLGPRYRVYEPKEISRRRREAGIEIDPQSKRIITPVATGVVTGVATGVEAGVSTGGKAYGSTPASITPVTPARIAGVSLVNDLNTNLRPDHTARGSSSNSTGAFDDEAFAGLISRLRQTATELTGREPAAGEASRWEELADVLVTELKLAAGRTTVSSVPAFLAEHLRRRLWKKDKAQLEREEESPALITQHSSPKGDAKECPDCFGTGHWYPEGIESGKGVAKCRHPKLRKDEG